MPTALRLEDLPDPSRTLAQRSLDWLCANADATTGLFRLPGDPAGRIRESAWLAHGLLLRDASGDREHAAAILERVLGAQIQAPEEPWHGTFARLEGEAAPAPGARQWIDYDPNWRQFLGCSFALLLQEHGALLDSTLRGRLRSAIGLAREGEPPERVGARYTNIALLKSWLDAEAGDPAGSALFEEVARRFDLHGAFDEYGSPTYYGVDLYALALWRLHAATAESRARATRIWDALWCDVADFYHAGLRNLAGPYSRAYGMDMCAYVSLLGLWIESFVGAESAPVPASGPGPLAHGHDFALAPSIALLASRLAAGGEAPIPDAALLRLRACAGERSVARTISEQPLRRATAWLGDDVAIGGESSALDFHGHDQYHPATIHWRLPGRSEQVGWLRARHDGPVDARADRGRLSLVLGSPADREGRGTTIEISAPGLAPAAIGERSWRLPGLALRVESDGPLPRVESHVRGVDVRYEGAGDLAIRMTIEHPGAASGRVVGVQRGEESG